MIIDLRSDTVTQPTPAMREAISRAEVADDVYGEDPTVNHLEEMAAQLLGKEAALFVPTGTMGNQISIRLHTRSGDEMITETHSHIFLFESAAPASLSGVQCRCLSGDRGILTAQQVEEGIRTRDDHFPETKLICLENTHNRGGGSVYSLKRIQEISAVAKKHNIAMHMDGARLFNAVTATGVKASEYADCFDTVSFCLSKGLGAPVGSLVCSTKESVTRLRRIRKMFGGGMRQAGILAAAGVYALQNHVERLQEDHRHAKELAQSLAKAPGVKINPAEVESNIVIFDVSETGKTAQEIVAKAKSLRVLVSAVGPTAIRAVTHLDVSSSQIREACETLARILR